MRKRLALSLAILALPARALAAEPLELPPVPEEPAPVATPAPPAAPTAIAPPVATTPVRAEAAPAVATPKREPRKFGIDAQLALRMNYLDEDGYQPFSSGSSLSQGSLTLLARYRFDPKKPFEIAAGIAYDGGGSTAKARGFDTELDAHRLTVVVEPRYFLFSRLYGFARVGAGPAITSLQLNDNGPSGNLGQTQVTFAVDAGAGIGFYFAELSRDAHVGVVADGGYGFAGSKKVRLEGENGEAIGSGGTLDLGALAMRGGYWRIGVGGAF